MPQDTPPPAVTALDHLVLTVADIPATLAFYEQVLGMKAQLFTTAAGEVRQSLQFGQAKINLHQAGREFDPKAHCPTPGSADLCFLTDTPLDQWQARLAAVSVPIEEGPGPRSGATGPILSIYIRDPDGNLIEISTRA